MKRTYTMVEYGHTIRVKRDTKEVSVCPNCNHKKYMWIIRPETPNRRELVCFNCGHKGN